MALSKKDESYFVITYRDPRDAKVCSLKARKIQDSSLGLSFVSISDFIFEVNGTVVNPTEEQQQHRFQNVRSFHLSIYSIISIEEMGPKRLKFTRSKSNLLVLGTDQPKF